MNTATIPSITIETQAPISISATTKAESNGKPKPENTKPSEVVITKSPEEINRSNEAYFQALQSLKIEKAIRFIEEIRTRKIGLNSSGGLIELYENPNGGSNAVVLYGVGVSDLRFICNGLSVGGFSVPRTDEKGRIVTAIHDEDVFNAYRERFPETPIITDFYKQQELRYEAVLAKATNQPAKPTTPATIEAKA